MHAALDHFFIVLWLFGQSSLPLELGILAEFRLGKFKSILQTYCLYCTVRACQTVGSDFVFEFHRLSISELHYLSSLEDCCFFVGLGLLRRPVGGRVKVELRQLSVSKQRKCYHLYQFLFSFIRAVISTLSSVVECREKTKASSLVQRLKKLTCPHFLK